MVRVMIIYSRKHWHTVCGQALAVSGLSRKLRIRTLNPVN